ncbi:RtcB family protein [Desulfobacula sp.]|uniref:RtcB family protein n=1 Tax=Desulfobacula sp. TaxID=2593537 RepID=UPI0025BDDD84|nr:RtcB family protein [Desulfobacula sp.]
MNCQIQAVFLKKKSTNRMTKKAKYTIFGKDLDPAAISQMEDAISLPVSVKGALMPDAHLGYGLPIGGVLAVKDAIIPYAVGVDIACRMKMSVLPIPFKNYQTHKQVFRQALETQTKFGVGEEFSRPRQHRVMDEDWTFSHVVKSLKDKAHKQLGTSGSGNHFAEFGRLYLTQDDIGLTAGEYIAFLTHSGSRGAGARIADHYSNLAKRLHPELGKPLNNLAWLDMKKGEGIEYFKAMELMGRYASASHEIIHTAVLSFLGEESIATIENHHNFAWKEKIGLHSVIVHRKGATPADKGVLGIIPGSMADPGFIVRGLGNDDSLNSAAHGAGRQMSRNAAMKRFSFKDLQKILQKKEVTLISAGLDEIPMAYKNIEVVMDQQKDLVETVAKFEPRLVKMAPPGRKKRRKKRK